MEGRLKFVERTPAIGGLASASALSAASAPASPIKEPDAACVLATLRTNAHCCASLPRTWSNVCVCPLAPIGRTAPKPSNVIYTPAAPAEGVSTSSQPKVGMSNQLEDSHDDTLDFVEAVAARFSGTHPVLFAMCTSPPSAICPTSLTALHGVCRGAPVLGRLGGRSARLVGVRVDSFSRCSLAWWMRWARGWRQ